MMIETCPTAVAAAGTWDAIIVGAGPAGSAAALRLAKAGRRVLLVDRDRMPRGKVCGCCLSPAALRELHDLEVIEPAALADILAAAVRAGAAWLPEATVVAVADEEGSDAGGSVATATIRTPIAGTQIVHGTTVIIAAGLADHVRVHGAATAGEPRRATAAGSRMGVGAVLPATPAWHGLAAVVELLPGELIMAVGHSGYCGLVRLEDGRIDLAAAVDRRAVSQGGSPACAVEEILREACGGSPRFPPGTTWRATPPLSHTAPLVTGAGRRIFRIGDAAGYVEPFTGEGIGWALASGRLVAEAMLEAATPAAAAARFECSHQAHFSHRHARCRRVARGLRIPVVVAAAVRAARLMPWAARLLAPAVVGQDASDMRRAVCGLEGLR